MREDAERGLKPEAGDWAHLATKAALSAIPVVGGPAAELFSAILIPPLARRRDEWLQALADGLRDLQERVRGFRVESLSNNEAFVTAVMHASQTAIRNHQREKRQALRNAVLNVAANRAPKEDVQLMFLNFIDTLTPWHLHVLRFFQLTQHVGLLWPPLLRHLQLQGRISVPIPCKMLKNMCET